VLLSRAGETAPGDLPEVRVPCGAFGTSSHRRRGILERAVGTAGVAELLPNLQAMDGDGRIDLEPEADAIAGKFKDRDLEQLFEAGGPPDHDGFLFLPRQHQHGSTSVFRPS